VLISSHALNELEDRAERHVLIMNRGFWSRRAPWRTAHDLAAADPGVASLAPGERSPAWMNGAV
jgi:hypothetical protein